jgi:hypothetical protein
LRPSGICPDFPAPDPRFPHFMKRRSVGVTSSTGTAWSGPTGEASRAAAVAAKGALVEASAESDPGGERRERRRIDRRNGHPTGLCGGAGVGRIADGRTSRRASAQSADETGRPVLTQAVGSQSPDVVGAGLSRSESACANADPRGAIGKRQIKALSVAGVGRIARRKYGVSIGRNGMRATLGWQAATAGPGRLANRQGVVAVI